MTQPVHPPMKLLEYKDSEIVITMPAGEEIDYETTLNLILDTIQSTHIRQY